MTTTTNGNEAFEIYASAPTRVDLAGGTLDFWPLYNLLGSAITINVAIDIKTHAILRPNRSSEITLNVRDLSALKTYSNLAICLHDDDPNFLLLRKHVAAWRPLQGFELETWSESPIGGGLGGSSSLSISISAAFSHWLDKRLERQEDVEGWVKLVSNVESQVLQMPTGTQDYYPPILGGLNALHYGVFGCDIKKLITPDQFEEKLLLVYTGQPHHSGMNNWQVIKDCLDGRAATLTHLKELKSISEDLSKMFENRRFDWTQIFDSEYQARVQISSTFSSPEIERLREVALRAGASAVKICGAGGGGCVLIWCEDTPKERVAEECLREGFHVLKAKPQNQGVRVEKRRRN